MRCQYCHAPMVLATESRGFRTYRCKRGCTDYRHEEIPARPAAPTISAGITQNGPGANDASAQTADTILH